MENLWVGYSKVHGWVVLDRARNRDQSKSIGAGMLLFKKYNVWLGGEYLESKNNWEPPQYIYGPNYINQLSGQNAIQAEKIYQKLMTYEKTKDPLKPLNPFVSLLDTVFSIFKSMLLFIRGGYDISGYNNLGYDKGGYNRLGFNPQGYNVKGYDRRGYDINGYDRRGYDIKGYDRRGYDIKGYSRRGYDKDGYNVKGFNRAGYNRKGNDQYGFNKDGLNRLGKRRYISTGEVVSYRDTAEYKKYKKLKEI